MSILLKYYKSLHFEEWRASSIGNIGVKGFLEFQNPLNFGIVLRPSHGLQTMSTACVRCQTLRVTGNGKYGSLRWLPTVVVVSAECQRQGQSPTLITTGNFL